MEWNLVDVVALSRLGRLDSHDRIALMQKHPSLNDALAAIGAADIGLRDEAQRIINEAEEQQVSIVPWTDERYPAMLRTAPSPPLLLYVKGALSDTIASIAVVGTRMCTIHYGKPVTERLVKEWVEAGCCIVSGLASGIDTLAHECCLTHHGITIAVIASGIGRITPKPARRLADRIVDNGGAVVSEHPFHIAALPPFFPARNRIIVGLSQATVVIESKQKGGALITADFAQRSGRTLWSVPGPITSTRSLGTNALIASGTARMLTDGAVVLTALGIEPTIRLPSPLPADLELLGGDSHAVTAIAKMWNTTLADASTRLLMYELEGRIEHVPGSRYRIT